MNQDQFIWLLLGVLLFSIMIIIGYNNVKLSENPSKFMSILGWKYHQLMVIWVGGFFLAYYTEGIGLMMVPIAHYAVVLDRISRSG